MRIDILLSLTEILKFRGYIHSVYDGHLRGIKYDAWESQPQLQLDLHLVSILGLTLW